MKRMHEINDINNDIQNAVTNAVSIDSQDNIIKGTPVVTITYCKAIKVADAIIYLIKIKNETGSSISAGTDILEFNYTINSTAAFPVVTSSGSTISIIQTTGKLTLGSAFASNATADLWGIII